jgi:hypothetical protein
MTGMTRGPLPARVYWVRRLTVLAIAALLVVGLARLLGGSGGGGSGDTASPVADTATTQAATPSAQTTNNPTSSPTLSLPSTNHQRLRTSSPSPLAAPTGPCPDDDVMVEPSVPHPVAGSDIDLVLKLSTVTTPACSWQLSGKTLALKITSGPDLIWTTVQCAKAVPHESLVLRNSRQTTVKVTWNARRSSPGCHTATDWALPGTYHLYAAALAGKPQQTTFALTAPAPAQVTRTAHPHQHGNGNGKGH